MTAAASRTTASTRPAVRIDGVDAARGIALIGMFVAHVAPVASTVDANELIALADDRPRLLFALTAGIGLGLISGAVRPVTDRVERGVLRRQIAIRAVLLIALGVFVVVALRPLVFVILDVYGVAFLVMLPLLFLPARAAILLGTALLTMTPAIAAIAERDPQTVELADSPIGLLVTWFLVGAYPVIIWVPVMLIGLGMARAGVASPRVVQWSALVAVAVACIALPLARLLPDLGEATIDSSEAAWSAPVRASLETLGNTAVGVGVVAGAIALTALAVPAVRRTARSLLSPITAMGAMPLTIYTLHLVVLGLAIREENGVVTDDSWPLLIGLVVGSLVFAWLWRRYLGRGPLERMLRWASGRGRDLAAPAATSPGTADSRAERS